MPTSQGIKEQSMPETLYSMATNRPHPGWMEVRMQWYAFIELMLRMICVVKYAE